MQLNTVYNSVYDYTSVRCGDCTYIVFWSKYGTPLHSSVLVRDPTTNIQELF